MEEEYITEEEMMKNDFFLPWVNRVSNKFRCKEYYTMDKHIENIMKLEDIIIEWERLEKKDRINQIGNYCIKINNFIKKIIEDASKNKFQRNNQGETTEKEGPKD